MSVSPGYLPAIMFTGSREESTEFSEDGTVVKYSVKLRTPAMGHPSWGQPIRGSRCGLSRRRSIRGTGAHACQART